MLNKTHTSFSECVLSGLSAWGAMSWPAHHGLSWEQEVLLPTLAEQIPACMLKVCVRQFLAEAKRSETRWLSCISFNSPGLNAAHDLQNNPFQLSSRDLWVTSFTSALCKWGPMLVPFANGGYSLVLLNSCTEGQRDIKMSLNPDV